MSMTKQTGIDPKRPSSQASYAMPKDLSTAKV
jgi:hypothetical protein